MSRSRVLAWGAFALTVANLGAAVALGAQHGRAAAVAFVPVMLSFAAVGAVVASRLPRNAIGWLFLGDGLIGSIIEVTQEYARLGASPGHHLPGAAWSAWVFTIGLEWSLVFLVLALALFPDGRVPSARWRPIIPFAIGLAVVGASLTALADTNFSRNFPRLTDPIRLLPESVARAAYGAAQLGELVLLALAAAAVVVRLRRSRGVERQQLKLFAYATVLVACGLVALAMLPLGVEPVAAFIVLVPLLPVSAGIAIMKYRLYDIDVVISKTVVYGALAAFISLVYVAIVVGVGSLVGNRSNPALSLAATAIVALAFQPARERVRRFANRLVYGRRATPYDVMAGFSRRVSETLSVEQVLPEMVQAAAQGVGAGWAEVLLFLPGGGHREVVWPPDATRSQDRVSRVMDVRYQGSAIGAIAVEKPLGERLSPAEDRLLADLATQAGLALHNVRLTEELAIRVREVAEQSSALQVSRQRLVTARDAQRRGLEQDIREGPQRQLTEIGMGLQAANDLADHDPTHAERILDHLGEQANATLEGLRDLARGIFPPLLAEKGVAVAVEAHIRKVEANAKIKASASFVGRRFEADVEAGIYFCCLQAIQNVMRHAGNAPAVVTLDVEGDEIAISVVDDGIGFDVGESPRGMGLQIVQDRVDALEGSLEVSSVPGVGTSVRVRIPVAIGVPA